MYINPVSSRWLLSRHVVALAVLVLLAWMAAGFEYYDKHSQTAGQVPEFRLYFTFCLTGDSNR